MIRVHNEAVEDLRNIRVAAPADAGKLVALIQQLKADPSLQAQMHQRDSGEDRQGPIGVKRWSTMYRETRQKPVYRMRAWDLEKQGLNYRLLYIFDWTDQSFNILAVVARAGLDYDDSNHPIRQRIAACIRRDFSGA